MNHVLDASAVLAWILKEPGSERVRELMESGNCLLSGVNAAEVVAKLADKDRPAAALRQVVAHIGAECIPFDAAQATEAGLLRPLTRHLGLSSRSGSSTSNESFARDGSNAAVGAVSARNSRSRSACRSSASYPEPPAGPLPPRIRGRDAAPPAGLRRPAGARFLRSYGVRGTHRKLEEPALARLDALFEPAGSANGPWWHGRHLDAEGRPRALPALPAFQFLRVG